MPGANLTRREAQERARLIRTVKSYRIELDLTGGPETFSVKASIDFDAEPGSASFIDALTDRVHRIELNGQQLASSLADGQRISLPNLAAHNQLTIEADFYYTNTGEGLHRFVDPVDQQVYLYTQFEVPDARRVYPVFEQPDLKASFEFIVTAPQDWVVVSNQAETRIDRQESTATWYFKPTAPISSYITAIIAGPYHKVTSSLINSAGKEIPLGIFARQSLMAYLDHQELFEITRQGFEFFEQQFKTPYPFEKYDQLFVPEFNAGAMENAGAVTFVESYIFRSKTTEAMVERRAITVLHELAHMWFGDLVTMRWWNDLWLNESFAEFMSTLAAAENTRFADQAWATFCASEKTWAYRQDQLSSTHPIVANIRDLNDVLVNFDGITYAKGASVLRQLVAWVGQENFMKALTRYFNKHAYRNTELADLLTELEQSSGRDVSAWSKLWLETAGVNTLTCQLKQEEGTIKSLAIVQSHDPNFPTLRPHRLLVGFYQLEGQKLIQTQQFDLDVDGQITELKAAAGLKQPDLILINDQDLAYAKIRLDPQSQAAAMKYLSSIESATARAVLWGSLWDCTRDGEIPARHFVDLVLDHIGQETNSTTLRTQLLNLELTLESYLAPETAQEIRVRTADRLWELTCQAPADSDSQLQLLRSFCRAAQTPQQLDQIEDLLSGQKSLAGLKIDTDLTWTLVTALAAGGRRSEEDIDRYLAQDNTANGQQAAATARAAIPTPAAKEQLWQQVILDNSLSNTLQRAGIAGFFLGNNKDLFDPYISRYFQAIEGIWRRRSHEISQTIILGLFPRNYSEDLLQATEQYLAGLAEDAAALHRQISECRDAVLRALKAQQVDRQA